MPSRSRDPVRGPDLDEPASSEPTTMRAARVIARRRLACDRAPLPAMRPGAAMVRTLVASLCGSDLHVVDLGYAGKGRPTHLPGPAGFPGHESVVEVVDPGGGPHTVGERYLAVPPANLSAAYAEFQVVDHGSLLPLPPDDRWERYVLAQQLGTVAYGFDTFWPGSLEGRTVAIVGAGSAGLLFTHEARRRGAEQILVSDPSAFRRALAARAGADHTIDGREASFPETVVERTEGRGADLVVDASGEDDGRADAVHALARDATLGLFGLPERSGSSPFELATLFERRARALTTHSAQLEPGLRSFRRAIERIASDELEPLGLLTHRYPLEDIDAAFAAARARDDAVKILVDVSDLAA
jgi:L-iditol 2-dehydrogenase